MLVLLSPSKTLDLDPTDRALKTAEPALLNDSEKLIKILKKMKEDEIGTLMSISPKLAALNYERFQSFARPFNNDNAKAALLAFKGDVYDGLDAASLSDKQLEAAQHSIRILSGLYGILKPLDLMQPYRLEMGTSLKNPNGKNLYQFWGDKLTETLNAHLKEEKTDTIINLASNEYFSAVQPKKLNGRLVTVHFKEEKNGQLKVIGLFAKKARGMMARYILTQNCKNVDAIHQFSEAGYRFQPELSSENDFIFARASKKG